MKFTVTSNASAFLAYQKTVAKQIRFATAVALTRTANQIKVEEVSTMRRVFDRPTPFALNSLQVKPATKTNLEATVETKLGFGSVPAGRFLSPQVEGGTRRMKSHERKLGGFTHPSKDVKLNSYGNLTGGFYTKVLSQIGALGNGQDATSSARSKRKRRAEAFFRRENIIFSRKGEDITPVLIITDTPGYRKRFPFNETAEQIFDRVFPVEFDKALDQALATAK